MNMQKKKILVADPSLDFLCSFKKNPNAHNFTIEIALTGLDCLKKVETFQPDLLIVDFMLPGMHGIEILNTIKNNDLLKKPGIILSSYNTLVQNYNSAIKLGAAYFIEKPCTLDKFFEIIDTFFKGMLVPIPFSQKPAKVNSTPHPLAIPKNPSYLKLWGTRGSNPVAGAEYVRFGGSTPSLEIRNGEDILLIDAGTGIRGLGQVLHDQQEKKINILLSHTHWDHLLGFPFFYPIYREGQEIHIWAPVGFEKTTKELFSDMLAYAYFPVSLDDIQSTIFFHDLRDKQTIDFGSIRISTHYAYHPGPTLCFKIEIKGLKIGYVTDNEFLMGCHLPCTKANENEELFAPYQSLISFLSNCDLLIHESQYFDKEYETRLGWGHSSITNASLLVKKAGIKRWIITHHDPRHNDELLLQKYQQHLSIMDELQHKCKIQLGYDGMMIALEELKIE
jgi:ribonuclease BN (tRNA processing enzyme)/ActR/RegA family two-component response regulator